MKKMDFKKECFYCDKDLTFSSYEYYNFMIARKPKGASDRWVLVGCVCPSCEARGLETSIDKFI